MLTERITTIKIIIPKQNMTKTLKTIQNFALCLVILAITSCTAEKDLPESSSLNENLKKFADRHISISKEIITLVNNENELNFDNFPYSDVQSFQNEGKYKLALANTGMTRYEEMYNLLLRQNQNATEFIANNKDFTLLKQETRTILITDAINSAIINNPQSSPDTKYKNTQSRLSCNQQYTMDREDCAEDALINWGILAGGCWFGTPAACGVGAVGVLAISANCSRRAKRDLQLCAQ